MSSRRLLAVAAILLLVVVGVLLWPRRMREREIAPPNTAPKTTPAGANQQSAATPTAVNASASETDYPIAAPLNAPNSTLARDLDTLSHIFDAWRSNFPREGNPVGENADITAALMGENRLSLVLIPRNHRAINAQGELCDRWGTPFRFHQLSGEHMEIRSAGPDKKFATEDDAVWTPQ
jgi:hypothetical protein